jgi:hypothetical protein
MITYKNAENEVRKTGQKCKIIHVTDVMLHVMIMTYTNNKVNKSLVNFAIKAQFLIELQKA